VQVRRVAIAALLASNGVGQFADFLGETRVKRRRARRVPNRWQSNDRE
jgi:hypothetical protein